MLVNRMAWAMVVGLLAMVAWPVLADENENTIDLGKVPASVKAAASKAVPGATWKKAYKETEKGKTIYELEGTDANGSAVEVEVSADGKVIEVETEITLDRVPPKVMDAFKAKFPKTTVDGAEEVTQDGKVIGYDLEIKKGGKTTEYRVSPDGKKITIEEDEDDD